MFDAQLASPLRFTKGDGGKQPAKKNPANQQLKLRVRVSPSRIKESADW
jgi:hypothetical protein